MSKSKERSTQNKGKAVEHLFFSMLLKKGYNIYTPLVDAQGVDAIVQLPNGKYIEIQIKSREPDAKKSYNFANISYIPNRPNYWFAFLTWKDDIHTWWLLNGKDFETHACLETKGTWSITLNTENETLNHFKLNCDRWNEFELQ
jgi:hypothetical protein